ncbi:PepSY-associated TM helix domain-containing protein [Sphingosinicella soli]|uniref:Putative iron-regulated membrane protein n=1 Tax=Sphingosinicella soli TaxID=333708 RepID=A0A7W7B097_9SPHN|nr:PepSY-associated TM helix domain-containing protein [Sphingosinicella soli]MBB4631675.1 putative iron-regulated membrane protein [Sphingosinicella soli]
MLTKRKAKDAFTAGLRQVRRSLRQIHLWLGLSLGALFVVLGLTGSALVFYVEIDAALHRDVRADASLPAPGWDSPVWDQALATARAHRPDARGEWAFEVTGEGGPIPARYYPPSPHHGHHAEREMLWFSSDGSTIVRSDAWGSYLMSWLYELHMHLLAGEIGRQIVGWSGFAMLVLLATGIAVWWPRGHWRKALAFKRSAVPLRRLRDIHKLSGLWSALLLFALVATGALLALPGIKTQMFAAARAAPDEIPSPRSGAASGPQIPITTALAAAHAAMPDARLAFIDVPGIGDKPFRMRVRVPGDPQQRFPGSFVFVDQYSGEVLGIHDVRLGNAATAVNSWIRPIHDGSIGGLWGRILAVILGFVPLLLFITGFLHRRRRLAARAGFHSTGSLS